MGRYRDWRRFRSVAKIRNGEEEELFSLTQKRSSFLGSNFITLGGRYTSYRLPHTGITRQDNYPDDFFHILVTSKTLGQIRENTFMRLVSTFNLMNNTRTFEIFLCFF